MPTAKTSDHSSDGQTPLYAMVNVNGDSAELLGKVVKDEKISGVFLMFDDGITLVTRMDMAAFTKGELSADQLPGRGIQLYYKSQPSPPNQSNNSVDLPSSGKLMLVESTQR